MSVQIAAINVQTTKLERNIFFQKNANRNLLFSSSVNIP
jgi:hypothetical protein